ncbi:MAG: cupin domain-containing protein [Actinobacteria bacterium]|nr:cupin domain-containing protein [Actinomycetota bacterium]
MGKDGRTFVRGIASQKYGLSDFRRRQLEAPRVRGDEVVVDDAAVGHSGDSKDSRTWWRLGPGDDPFLTQNLQVHFVELPPGKSNHGHGHQNEAIFYVLEGRGYEIHDDLRYDWEAGDAVIVHTDSVHRHFNASEEERAVCLVVKAKSTWMFLGLIQQGRSGPVEDEDRFGPRVDWSQLWTPRSDELNKVVKSGDRAWELTPDGHVKTILSKGDDARAWSVDLFEQRIPGGSRSAKHWHMADEIVYVLSGSGYSLHWEVEAEIAERYYARVAMEPTRHEFQTGDVLYVPQNVVHQHFNSTGDEPLRILSAQNRLIKYLGYDNVVYLEEAPEFAGAPVGSAAAT